MPCIDILTGKMPVAQQLAIFDRIIPNFSFEISDRETHHIENIELNNWYQKISADEDFINDVTTFIMSNQSVAITFINVQINNINRVIIYIVLKKDNTINFYNLIEIANLINNAFQENIWDIIRQQIETEHIEKRILHRNYIASFFALNPLFVLCYKDFNGFPGKSKYFFGEVMFYFNEKRKWDRKGNNVQRPNSGRTALFTTPKGNTLNRKIYNQAIAYCKFEKNIFIIIQEKGK